MYDVSDRRMIEGVSFEHWSANLLTNGTSLALVLMCVSNDVRLLYAQKYQGIGLI